MLTHNNKWNNKKNSKNWLPSSLIYTDHEYDFEKYDSDGFDDFEQPPPVHIVHPKPNHPHKSISSQLRLASCFKLNFCFYSCKNVLVQLRQLISPLLLGSLLVNLLLLKYFFHSFSSCSSSRSRSSQSKTTS